MTKLITSLKRSALATMFISILHHTVGNHQPLGGGCSTTFQGINEISNCLYQKNSSYNIALQLSPCCGALNQAIQTGFYCLCSLLAAAASSSRSSSSANGNNMNHIPVLNSFHLSTVVLSGCNISVPSLALCRVLGPMPIVLPPDHDQEVNGTTTTATLSPPAAVHWAYLPINVSSKPNQASELKPHLNTSVIPTPTAALDRRKQVHYYYSSAGGRRSRSPTRLLCLISWLLIVVINSFLSHL